jgi:hypothetical protein
MKPEDLLTNALNDRVERTHYPSTPLSTVAGRAGAMRARRRRTTMLAAAAAVGVVVVPGAVWLGHTPGGSSRPTHELSSGPTTQPTSQPTAHSSGPLVLDALPLGRKPGIDYLVGDTYVTRNGGRITSPVFQRATSATPVRGGIIVSIPPAAGLATQGGIGSTDLVSNGRHQFLGCGSDRFAMSTDGVESAYWLADTCKPGPQPGRLLSGATNTMGESGGNVATPSGSVYEPIGILRQGTVVNVRRGKAEHAAIVDRSGSRSPITGLAYAGGSDENNDVVSGQLAGDSATGAIVDAASGAVKVRVPGWVLGQFSIDGRYVLGYQPGDGIGTDSYAVFDAGTGSKVVELPHLGMTVALQGVSWDVDGTVLAVAHSTRGSAIVRFDLQGHLTRATPMADTPNGYRLATRP